MYLCLRYNYKNEFVQIKKTLDIMGPRTQDVSRMYIRLSEDVQDVP